MTLALNIARVQFLSWVQAHQALASGVKDPAKWLQIGKDIVKFARSVKKD